MSRQRDLRPRVLFITGHLPYPPLSGGRRRELELITRLAGDFDFNLLVPSKTYEEDRTNVHVLEGNGSSVQVWPAGLEARPSKGVPRLVRRSWSPEAAAVVRQALRAGEVDLVHVERFQLIAHVPDPCPVPLLLVEQNIEYDIWHQRLKLAGGGRVRRRQVAEYAATVQAEIEAWRRASMLGAVTEEDRATMLAAVPELEVRIIPHGTDPSRPAASPGGSTLLFLANFAYRPNAEAALFLARDIYPRVRSAVPAATLLLVGNEPPPDVALLAGPGIHVAGRVPSPDPFLDAADVVVCPLRQGGGIKAKVVEALARGKAIVTTSVGAQGFGAEAALAMRIADGPRAIAAEVIDLLRHADRRRELEVEASRLASRLPTWDQSAAALHGCYRDLLARRGLFRR